VLGEDTNPGVIWSIDRRGDARNFLGLMPENDYSGIKRASIAIVVAPLASASALAAAIVLALIDRHELLDAAAVDGLTGVEVALRVLVYAVQESELTRLTP